MSDRYGAYDSESGGYLPVGVDHETARGCAIAVLEHLRVKRGAENDALPLDLQQLTDEDLEGLCAKEGVIVDRLV